MLSRNLQGARQHSSCSDGLHPWHREGLRGPVGRRTKEAHRGLVQHDLAEGDERPSEPLRGAIGGGTCVSNLGRGETAKLGYGQARVVMFRVDELREFAKRVQTGEDIEAQAQPAATPHSLSRFTFRSASHLSAEGGWRRCSRSVGWCAR